ncbi:MAG: ABC transporter substrate-binding protein [candidate division NC10 bacterium RIFCSPLOWO2_12_FULL_66_18]|nr:MAG: ABC transporter substrate-binding protein [candidate division NC10 bacterium RIFCSPLOWO2_02_FULL_66_22]OGC01589.1 MAG: ABC transporter substrate-binding protein [candidate division NC10 bacterium RIFCSPLOWO2_12_FULL_66_18]
MSHRITIAHSPDADDAFMFYALAQGKVSDPELECVHVLEDIQSLNERAFRGEYEVTAVSFHAYAYLADRYALLPHGASMGDGYGPMVVARDPLSREDLQGKSIAVPGTLTTAFLLLKLWNPSLGHRVIPFDQILDAVVARRVHAGLIIHEGQVTYGSLGLHKVVDFGEWWKEETGLPLPLGGNVIRKDLGPALMRRVSHLLRESIAYALAHREEALNYAMQFGRDMDRRLADRFVAMYVNDLTLDYGERGRAAVKRLLAMGHERGLIPHRVEPEFVG